MTSRVELGLVNRRVAPAIDCSVPLINCVISCLWRHHSRYICVYVAVHLSGEETLLKNTYFFKIVNEWTGLIFGLGLIVLFLGGRFPSIFSINQNLNSVNFMFNRSSSTYYLRVIITRVIIESRNNVLNDFKVASLFL